MQLLKLQLDVDFNSKLFQGYAAEEAHLIARWYTQKQGFWKNIKVEEIVRAGYIHAIGLMNEFDAPIDTAWQADQPDGKFMWTITISPPGPERVIHMTLHTPPANEEIDQDAAIDDPCVFVIETDANGDPIVRQGVCLP